MKLHLILSLVTIAGAFAAETASNQENKTPEQLRKGLKKRGLQSSDGGDAGADDGAGSAGCFSALTKVEVQGKGSVDMASLKIGDYVRSGKHADDYSRVFSFGHLDPDFKEKFLQIHAEGNSQPIELTGNHMVFVDSKPVRADTVKVGDMLDNSKVTLIKSVERSGVFAPITESGEIVVNGVRASSYVAFLEGVLVNQHALTHMFFAPQRMLCSVNFSFCENETYTDGFSDYSNWAIQTYMNANNWGAFAKHAITFAALVILPFFASAEQAFFSPLLSLAVAGFVVYKAKTKKVKSA